VVIQSFCDYGSTLKNLPDDEHVSIIVKLRKKERDSVFVPERIRLRAVGRKRA